MFSFSRIPLLAFYVFAGLSTLIGCSCIIWALYHKLVLGVAIPGWASITTVSAFFGAINALGIAILGEYVARIYDQVRNRPAYVVDETRNVGSAAEGSPDMERELLAELDSLRGEVALLRSVSETKPKKASSKRKSTAKKTTKKKKASAKKTSK
jgi:dolichol-phosphate mannosyltransferase